jgi:methylglyoxal reductase
VAFGAWGALDGRRDPRHCYETIRAAIDAGATTIDTSPQWEEIAGQAIRGQRDRVQVFTTIRAERVGVRDEVGFAVERSLRRLGVDVIDLVFVSPGGRSAFMGETLDALGRLLVAGKVRGLGVSASLTPAAVVVAQRALGEVPLAAVKVHYSLLDRQHEPVLALARAHRIGVIAHSALEMGLLTGTLSPSSTFAREDMHGSLERFHPDNVRLIASALQRGLEPAATRHGATIAQVALAWTLAQPGVSAVSMGAPSAEQVRWDVMAPLLQLSAEELRSMECVFDRLRLHRRGGSVTAQRVYGRARRAAGGARRRVVRALSRISPLPSGGDWTAEL